jgi:hypothetical protein
MSAGLYTTSSSSGSVIEPAVIDKGVSTLLRAARRSHYVILGLTFIVGDIHHGETPFGLWEREEFSGEKRYRDRHRECKVIYIPAYLLV